MAFSQKEWLVEVPDGILDVDADLERYLNSDPHPDYVLFQAIIRSRRPMGSPIYVLLWRLIA